METMKPMFYKYADVENKLSTFLYTWSPYYRDKSRSTINTVREASRHTDVPGVISDVSYLGIKVKQVQIHFC